MVSSAGRSETARLAVDVAQRLIQTRGYSRFSYADVAGELGVTKATLHYHFAGKADLGQAVLNRYVAQFYEALEVIDASDADGLDRFESYVDLYRQVLRGERMCMCGMLAAEIELLPPTMRAAVSEFFGRNVRWLEELFVRGAADGSLAPLAPAERRARAQSVLALLHGGMLSARATSSSACFEMVTGLLRQDVGHPVG
jgi:TetR/AcrR family transcriptional repressor of nem operon